MEQQFLLEAEYREEKKKNKSRRLRGVGYIPAIYYSKGENVPIKVRYSSFEKIYNKAHKTKVIELKIKQEEKEESKHAFIWDIQREPVKSNVIHVDFLGVDLSKEIEMEVPIKIVGSPKGVERGGVLAVYKETLIVKALPLSIPDHIEVDVSALDINDKIHVEEIKLPENVSLSYEEEKEQAVVGVEPPEGVEETEEPSEESVEGASSEES